MNHYTKESRHKINSAVFACLILIFVIVSSSGVAQRRKLISGSLNGLKGQKSYDLKFTYDDMRVGDYVEERQ